MQLTYVPLLPTQRRLHDLPRGPARFEAYLGVTLTDDRQQTRYPPLVAVNPMARDHVTALLDDYLRLDADGVAAAALAERAGDWADAPGEFQASVVLCDDAAGGWTNRAACEYGVRMAGAGQKRFWVTGYLWSSEPASAALVRQVVLAAAYRAARQTRLGHAPRSLRELMEQEGEVLRQSGWVPPALDAEELAYTRAVVEPFLDSDCMRQAVECLLGDAAAASLGFEPRGLSADAGLALALADGVADAVAAGG